jgi:tetratricopeptide (TPR) repeat protein
LLVEDNHPAARVKVDVRPFAGGSPATVFTNWQGDFQVGGLARGTYVVVVEESGYERVEQIVQVDRAAWGLRLYLRKANAAGPAPAGYVVSAHELGIPSKARKAFEKGIEHRAKKDPGGSLAHFQRAVELFPSYYEAYFQMGLVHLQLGQTADAENNLQKAIDFSSGRYANAEFAMGGLLADQEKFSDSERVTRRGLEQAPDSYLGQFELGRALLGLNRAQEAEQSAQKARSIKPDFSPVYLLLANIHYTQHAYALQCKDLDEYLRRDPNGELSARAREVRENIQRILSSDESASGAPAPKP